MDFDFILQLMNTPYVKRFSEILLAALLGGIIGLEREHRGQSAGFRTNMIISVGACLLMQLSIHIEFVHNHLDASSVMRIDPGRIASYAIASMGFLGAGAIIKGKGSVRGLTTAASMWLITAIGLCIGAGVIYPAIAVTCIFVVILYLFPIISSNMRRHRNIKLTLTFSNIGESVKEVKNILKNEGNISIKNTNYSRSFKTNEIIYVFNILGYHDTCMQMLSNKLITLKNLTSIHFDEAEVP